MLQVVQSVLPMIVAAGQYFTEIQQCKLQGNQDPEKVIINKLNVQKNFIPPNTENNIFNTR